MCKANNDIITKVQELMELRRMSEELQAEIDVLQEAVKDFMGSEETMIAGAFKVSYKSVTSSRLDSSALKRELLDIAARFTKQTVTLKRKRPAALAQPLTSDPTSLGDVLIVEHPLFVCQEQNQEDAI